MNGNQVKLESESSSYVEKENFQNNFFFSPASRNIVLIIFVGGVVVTSIKRNHNFPLIHFFVFIFLIIDQRHFLETVWPLISRKILFGECQFLIRFLLQFNSMITFFVGPEIPGTRRFANCNLCDIDDKNSTSGFNFKWDYIEVVYTYNHTYPLWCNHALATST